GESSFPSRSLPGRRASHRKRKRATGGLPVAVSHRPPLCPNYLRDHATESPAPSVDRFRSLSRADQGVRSLCLSVSGRVAPSAPRAMARSLPHPLSIRARNYAQVALRLPLARGAVTMAPSAAMEDRDDLVPPAHT